MKKLIVLVLLAFALTSPALATQKRFCHTYIQHGKSVKVCKMIYLHKKVDGKAIPKKSVR